MHILSTLDQANRLFSEMKGRSAVKYLMARICYMLYVVCYMLPRQHLFRSISIIIYISGQITGPESLFSYPAGKSFADYANASFVPAFNPTCSSTEMATATSLCGNYTDCIFDYCITKDSTIATATKNYLDAYNANRMILRKCVTIYNISY